MKWKFQFRTLTVVILLASTLTLPSDVRPPIPKGLFSGLRIGQAVSLNPESGGFQIRYFENDSPMTHKVIEIREDYIVVQDLAGVTETTVPCYALTSIVKVNQKRFSQNTEGTEAEPVP